jgi:hypothetical protein
VADDPNTQAAGSVETAAETKKSPSEFAKHWLQAIDMAGEDEKDWRKAGEDCLKRYSTGKARGFNILYANTQTTVPALYNSVPAPDVRRRFDVVQPTPPQMPQQPPQQPGMPPQQPDPAVQQAMMAYQQQVQAAKQKQDDYKQVSTALERALSVQSERYNLDGCLQSAVRDRQLPGRGVTRVRVSLGEAGSRSVKCEHVQWDDFRHGPGKTFDDWPWVAFQHRLTREELVKLAGAKIGKEVKLDAVVGDAPQKESGTDKLHDMFKRAICWEVWDKETREVYWFAESFPDGALTTQQDPYKLRDFIPMPEPLYQVKRTDTTTPVCEFTLWKALADEMDQITGRIIGLIKVLKAKGLYDGAYAGIITKLAALDDGELAAAADAGRSMAQGGIDKAVWMWPIENIVKVVEALYVARQQAKEAVYEFTGVADIQRGQTDPNETLGAQQLKAQWGSLRLQEAQRDVQRYARDLFRMMADLMAFAWDTPAEWEAVTGITLNEQQFALLQNDMQREFAIEIETDSTIQADLGRTQQNISAFITGLGAYFESIGPAVQMGYMPPEIAVGMAGAFARNFKLGREADDLFDQWAKQVEEKAKQPQQGPPPDPAMEKVKLDAERLEVEKEEKKARVTLDIEKAKEEALAKRRELELKDKEIGLKGAQMQQEATLRREDRSEESFHRQEDRSMTRDEGQATRNHASQEAHVGRQHESSEADKGRVHEHMQGGETRQHEAKMAEGGQKHERRMATDKADTESLAEPDETGATLAQTLKQGNQMIAESLKSVGDGLAKLADATLAESEVTTSSGKTLRSRKIPKGK